jgi:hypothetical protein
VAVVVWLAGCQPVGPIVPDELAPVVRDAPRQTLPTYNELTTQYNQRLDGLDQLWARTDVQLRWREEDGDARREDGDGKLIWRAPTDLVLTVEKVGRVMLWAGADASRYWLFDLIDTDQKTLLWGRQDRVGAAGLPLPVSPQALPHLLGLLPLPPADAVYGDGLVQAARGYWVVRPPGLALRLWIVPETLRPTQVELLDREGSTRVVARLEGSRSVEGLESVAVPQTVDIIPVDEEARFTLILQRVTTGEGRIRDAMFDLDRLVAAHRPQQMIDLDQQPTDDGTAPPPAADAPAPPPPVVEPPRRWRPPHRR